MTEAANIPERWQSRLAVAEAQLDLLPLPVGDQEDENEGLRFQCEEVIQLIKELGKAEAECKALREQVERLIKERDQLVHRVGRLTHTVD